MVPGAYSTISTPEERRSRLNECGLSASKQLLARLAIWSDHSPIIWLGEQRVLVEAPVLLSINATGLLQDAMNEAPADHDAETDIAIQLKAGTVGRHRATSGRTGDHSSNRIEHAEGRPPSRAASEY